MILNTENISPEIHKAKYAELDSSWSRSHFPYPYYRLYFITEGEGYIEIKEGAAPWKNNKISLSPGYVYLLPASILSKAVCPKYINQYYIHFNILSPIDSIIFEFAVSKLFYKAEEPAFSLKLFKIITEEQKKRNNSENKNGFLSGSLLSEGALKILISPFFENYSAEKSKLKKILPALKYINSNYNKNISNPFLAELLGFNPVYFSNLFTKLLKIPPQSYIIMKRISRAQFLLWNTAKSVKEIGYEAGIEDIYYFSRLFRQKTGLSPLEYRNRSRE